MALDIKLNDVRDEWGDFDLETKDKIRIEVKTSSYLQTWYQENYSKIKFSIKRKNEKYLKNNELNRPSDFYIFCLLNHKDKKTVEPLNMDQWIFYILSTKEINKLFKNINSISLKTLNEITCSLKFNEIKDKIYNEYKIL